LCDVGVHSIIIVHHGAVFKVSGLMRINRFIVNIFVYLLEHTA
jgi:hypothetical protein